VPGVDEARLEALNGGLAPVTDGWFVVNVRSAPWLEHDDFGARCIFERDPRIVRGRDDLEPSWFEQVGFKLAVVRPGQPSTLYHAETQQEAFLVLAGTCTAVIEEQERELREWDFVHCPPGTRHTFVNTGDAPCVILMVGARSEDGSIVYTPSPVAARYGAAVEAEADDPAKAYANRPHWRNATGPPDGFLAQ
jgi:uncharacterized cupin superfamily protein